MNNIKLSKRLQAIADFVPEQARLADIGSDHAFLPTYLVQSHKIKFAVAGEVVEGPFKIAEKQVKSMNLHNNIYVKLANGLEAIDFSDNIDTVVIAGMGGILIADILGKGQDKLSSFSHLILQPNNHEEHLRYWLSTHHFVINEEQLIREAGKFYEIIVAVPKKNDASTELSEMDLFFGPILSKQKSPIFRQKWEKELRTIDKILARLPQERSEKREEICKKQLAIEEVLS